MGVRLARPLGSLLFWVEDVSLSVDVDSVQELPDVLGSDEAGLVDLRGASADVLNVVTLQDELILDGLVLGDGDALQHLHDSHPLLAQEVSDLDRLSRVLDGDVDGEVSVNETHGVPESSGDAEEHVVDVRDDSSRSREPLARSVPHLDLDGGLAVDLDLVQIDLQVAQVPREGT